MAGSLPEDNALRRLHAEYATVRALAEAGSVAEAAPRILQAVCETFDWAYGGLWRVNTTGGVLSCVETWTSLSSPAASLAARNRETNVSDLFWIRLRSSPQKCELRRLEA